MKNTSKIFFGIIILVVIDFIVWVAIISESKSSEMFFLDVGQGDATLLNFFGSGKILVDAGPDESVLKSLGSQLGFFDRKIDVIILSHINFDHYGGLFYVLERYHPDVFVYNGMVSENETFLKLLEEFGNNGVQIITMKDGDKIKIGQDEFDFLWPPIDFSIKDDNNNSLIFMAVINGFRTLFPGDADYKTIKKVSASLKSDILKISHHGSKTGTDFDLINLINPSVALIGVGEDNSYGHPTDQVLGLLNQFGINLFRTDLNGTIRIIFDSLLNIKSDN